MNNMRMRSRLLLCVLIILGFTNSVANAASFPISDPSTTSFTAILDAGTFSNRIAGGISNILPVCSQGQTKWCVKSLEVGDENGKFNSASFLKYVDNGNRPATTPGTIIEQNSAISVWSFDDKGTGRRLFAVHSLVLPNALSTSVYEIKEIKSRVRDDLYNQMSVTSDYRLANPGYVDDCVYVSQGICGQRVSLKDSPLRIIEYVGTNYSSWFAGRLSGAKFQLINVNGDQSEVSASGSALKVPEVLKETPGQDRYVATGCTDPIGFAASHPHVDPTTLQGLCTKWKSDYEACFKENQNNTSVLVEGPCSFQTTMSASTLAVSPFLNNIFVAQNYFDSTNESTFEPTIWSFESSPSSINSACLGSNGFLGAVNTNATVFDAYPPLNLNGEINYQVASPHLNSQNLENSGYFELQMSSDVLRCMYSFSKAPIEVKVSVISEDGTNEVATTNWSESSGISRLSISGFHFSSPKLKISLTQQKSKPIAQIICRKGTSVRKLISSNPVCPKGFKKA